MKVGDVVIIGDPKVPCSVWKMGVMQRLRYSNDGQVRAAEIRVISGDRSVIIKRTANKLYLLERHYDIEEQSTQVTFPLYFTSNSMAYKEGSDVSKRTIKKRHQAVLNSLNVTSGMATTSKLQQTSAILNSFEVKDQVKILKMSDIPLSVVSAEEMISMKAHMGITYSNMKILARWLKTKDIKCASNKKQRKVAKSWSGEDWVVCNAPFNFLLKDSSDSFESKNAPWGYIKDLPSHITNKLNLLKK
ncbi:uncharacterized protein LOC136074041 [Hydra vulgaris]|uniref:Uncharacterized protein LOC136074041 n=1 Tax=Hydra vulgaris TaxID=6087 RepID=A0ABM4B0V6_HYDVU